MGMALAGRSLALVENLSAAAARGSVDIDLTIPAVSQLPEHVRAAAKDALDRGETHYTSRPGVPELRNAIARQLNDDGIPATGDSVIITNGGAEGVYVALQSIVAAGDRVLVVEPVARNVVEMIRFIGGEIARAAPSREDGLIPSVDAIASADASVLLIASPSSISGVAMSTEHLERLLRVAVDRGMVPIVDRSASTCYYEPVREAFDDETVTSNMLTVGSFSTGHGLLGWRVGYLAAPDERMGKLRNLKQAMSICTTAVSQFAALAALEWPDDWLHERRMAFAARRDLVIERLRAAGLDHVEPSVYPSLLIDVSPLGADDRDIAARLEREAGTRVEAGSDYGSATRGFIRINLAVDDTTLKAGVERIVAFARNGGTDV
jgi:aspartate aminotransferase